MTYAELDKTILVMDGDDEMRVALFAPLAERSYRVVLAGSSTDADRVVETMPLHLIILGQRLVDVDGISWLCTRRGEGNFVRVIFLYEVTPDPRLAHRLKEDLRVGLALPRSTAAATIAELVERQIGSSRPPRPARQSANIAEMLAALSKDYKRRLQVQLDDLTLALAQARQHPDDPAPRGAARFLAHRIAGTAGSYGFAAIGDQTRRIERALAEPDTSTQDGTDGGWPVIDLALRESLLLYAAVTRSTDH
jgi:HPt (histidine-containing phosphotransfer) domain-containing protein